MLKKIKDLISLSINKYLILLAGITIINCLFNLSKLIHAFNLYSNNQLAGVLYITLSLTLVANSILFTIINQRFYYFKDALTVLIIIFNLNLLMPVSYDTGVYIANIYNLLIILLSVVHLSILIAFLALNYLYQKLFKRQINFINFYLSSITITLLLLKYLNYF